MNANDVPLVRLEAKKDQNLRAMQGPFGQIERVAMPACPVEVYKRWLSSERMLVFALHAPTSSYRIGLYDCIKNTLTPCQDLDECRPKARIMPVSYFGADGQLQQREIVHLAPSAVLSPARKRVCWVSITNDLVVVDAGLNEAERFPREDLYELTGLVLWFADGVKFADALHSYSFKSIVKFNVYTFGATEFEVHDVASLRTGKCAGTTVDGIVIVINRLQNRPVALDQQEAVAISKVDLNAEHWKAMREKAHLPTGWNHMEVCLAPTSRLLAWLITRWEASTRYEGIWITDLRGCEVCPLVPIEKNALESLGAQTDPFGALCKDLEWLPDESGVSFVSGGCIFRMAVPLVSQGRLEN